MLVSENKGLYSKFTDKNIVSSRDYLANAYAREKVLYYNAPTIEQEKTRKKHTAKYIALILGTLAVGGSIALSLINKNKKIDLEYLNQAGKKAEALVKKLNIKEKFLNMMSNINTVKDDLWKRFSEDFLANIKIKDKHPFAFISKIGQKIQDLYLKIAPISYVQEWDKRKLKVLEALSKPGNENVKLSIPDFNDIFNQTVNNINTSLTKGGRVTKGIFNKDFFKTVSASNIADPKIKDAAIEALKEIKIEGEATPELKLALKELNDYKTKSFEKLLPKIRDILVGSGQTDVLTQLFSLSTLGVVVATSDTKEEKKSAIINLGIPLITALTTTNIALLKSISGAASLAFGLVLGEAASYAAKGISNLVANQKQKNYDKIKAQVLDEQNNKQH